MKVVDIFIMGLCPCLILMGCASSKTPTLDDMRQSRRLIDQGTLFLRQGKLTEARASFDMAREIDSAPSTLDGLGCVAMLEKRFELAQKYFIQAYQKDNQYTEALGNLALLYDLQGYHHEAEVLYRRALDQDPKNFRIRNNFAAFLHDNKNQYDIVVSDELGKAFSLVPHPLIETNLNFVNRRKYGSNQKEN